MQKTGFIKETNMQKTGFIKETNMQKTGTIIEDIFVIHNNYQDFGIVNKEELETTYDIIAEKGDAVVWYDDQESWMTDADGLVIPEDFVKVTNEPVNIIINITFDHKNIGKTISIPIN